MNRLSDILFLLAMERGGGEKFLIREGRKKNKEQGDSRLTAAAALFILGIDSPPPPSC